MRIKHVLVSMVLVGAIGCGGSSNDVGDDAGTDGGGCEPASSTFEAIQQNVFDKHGCTASTCHGQPAETAGGNLDLRLEMAFDSLVRTNGKSAAMNLVFPGDQGRSLLYWKLAALTDSTISLSSMGISGSPMPAGGQKALTDAELEAVVTWIRGGASETLVVDGTEELFACGESLIVDPNKIEPIDPPEPGTGVQFYSGAYPLPAESETENCFVSYYDVSAQVPADVRFPCPDEDWGEGRECFAYGRNELAQDAQSHHSIITIYTPEVDPNSTEWGDWTCLGGAKNGQACDPTDSAACGERSNCTTGVLESVACSGYDNAPVSFGGISINGLTGTRIGFIGAQESTFVDEPNQGVYAVQPVKGFIAWNSHAFNLTTKDTTVEQWVNVDFIREAERKWRGVQIFDVSRIFAMGAVQPYTSREVCHTVTLDRYSRMMTLSSHTHQHGSLFRAWLPTDVASGKIAKCSVLAEGESESFLDLFKIDPDCLPEEEEPLYVNYSYEDPLYLYFDTPLEFDSVDPEERTIKMCAVFDNGGEDESTLYRNSKASQSSLCESNPLGFGKFITSCGCDSRSCVGGPTPGAACGTDDAVCGEGGVCDACSVKGGLTTNDEMFVLLGSYYVQPPTDN